MRGLALCFDCDFGVACNSMPYLQALNKSRNLRLIDGKSAAHPTAPSARKWGEGESQGFLSSVWFLASSLRNRWLAPAADVAAVVVFLVSPKAVTPTFIFTEVRAMAKRMTKAVGLVSLGLAVGMSCGLQKIVAGPPSILSMFQERSASGTDQDLVLRNDHGPWMILAMTLQGDDAEEKAIALAKELRTMLRTEVYVHHKEIDHSQPLAQASAKLVDSEKQTLYTKRVRLNNAVRERTFAVLVGNYTDSDDPRIPEMLKKVKTAKPACLESKEAEAADQASKAKDTNWLITAKRQFLWQKNGDSAKKGKMGVAFVTRNPMLPDDYFHNGLDEFVLRLNEKVEHSLLQCPGRYTVRVASFTGKTVTELATPKEPKKPEDQEVTDTLDLAAIQAHTMTTELRKKGVEAYEFHDRNASYVTIGSFDSLGDVMPSGQFVYNPAMVSILNQWCGYEMRSVTNPRTGYVQVTPSCKTLVEKGIPFDVEGKFISVPKPTSAKLYGGNLLGKSRTGQ